MISRLKAYLSYGFFVSVSMLADAGKLVGPGTEGSANAQEQIKTAGTKVVELLSWIFGTAGVITFLAVAFLLMQGKKEEFSDRTWNIAYAVLAFTLGPAFMGFLYTAFS